MKHKLRLIPMLILGFALSPLAMADGTDDDSTMNAVTDTDNPDHVVALPDSAAAAAQENAKFGIDTATSARAMGSDFGSQMAEDAKSGTEAEQVGNSLAQEKRSEGESHSQSPTGG
jgi:hypothetical protein